MPKYYNKVPFIKKTDADWTSLNPILMDGEVILVTGEDEIVRLKVGDGISNYSDLDYISDGASAYGTRMKIGDGVSTYSNLRFVSFARGITQEQYEELLLLIEETNNKVINNEASIEEINDSLSYINSVVETLRTNTEGLTSELESHSTQLEKITTKTQELCVVTEELGLLAEEHEESLEALEDRTSSVVDTIEIFRGDISRHDESISTIFSNIEGLEGLKENVASLNTRVDTLTTNVDKNAENLELLKGRVDNIIDSGIGGSGGVPGDGSVNLAEVIDIRKGYKGNVYETAGDAVRALGYEIDELRARGLDPDDLGLVNVNGFVYPTYKGTPSIYGIKIEGVGGGGVSPTYLFRLINTTEQGTSFSVSLGDEVTVSYQFVALDPFTGAPTGNGTASYFVNSNQVATKTIKQGDNSFDCGKYLVAGTNTVKVTVKNADGETKSLEWEVNCISIRLTSTFDFTTPHKEDVTFKYTPYGEANKYIYFILDGVQDPEVPMISSSGVQYSKTFENLSHGLHTLEVYAIGYVNDVEVRSNTLKYDIIVYTEGSAIPIISINCDKTTLRQGELLSIPYIAYDPLNSQSIVSLEIYSLVDGEYELYKSETRSVNRALQYWNTRHYPLGDVRFTVRLGEVSRSFDIKVTEFSLPISPIETDLELYLSSANRSNSEENPAIWEYKTKKETITTEFNNVNWSSSGWISDSNGDTSLHLTGGSTATIKFKPFSTDLRQYGKTIEFEFAVKDINNRNANVISCKQGGIGIEITADSAILTSAMSSNSCHISDERKIRVSFTIEAVKEYRMMSIYLDGVLTTCKQYVPEDNFQQATPVDIIVGSPYCAVDLYTVRVYNTALTQKNIIDNYICDIADITEKSELYDRNNLYDTSMNLDYSKVKKQIQVMTITGSLPGKKGDKKSVTVTYEDPFDETMNFSNLPCTIDVQGTSSQYYVRKNYKLKFKQLLTHIKGSYPAKVFCMKADYAEATSTHNTQIANLVHYLYDEEDKTPAQLIDDRCRTTIQGFPCVIYHKETIDATPKFLGKYNFNYDKGSEDVFFGDQSLPEEQRLKVECWEFCNNTSEACNFTGNIPAEYSMIENINGSDVDFGWINDFERRYPDHETIDDGTEDPTQAISNFRKMHDWVVKTKTYDLNSEFMLKLYKSEFEKLFNLDKMLIYYVWTFFFLMVDQRAKNMFMTYWEDTKKWEPWFYDNDTCLGINNEGEMVFDYYHEDTDLMPDNTKVYNGQDSILWNKFRVAYANEIQATYQSLRSSGKLTYNVVRNQFVTEGSDKWSETIYNEDSDYKYISMLRDPNQNDATNLPQIKGTGEHHLDYFLDARLNYCDSKWYAVGSQPQADKPDYDPGYVEDYIFLRVNTPKEYVDVEPNANITITPFSDMYAGVRYRANGSLQQKRLKKNETYTFVAPSSDFNDTETTIYGASQLSSIGDLSTLYCNYCNVSAAKKLIELKVGSEFSSYTSRLKTLSLGNNTLLKKLDVRNCGSLTDPLNLSKCVSIEEIYAEGSSISGMNLADSGYLKIVHLPSTVVTLTLKNQNYIEDFQMESYANIRNLNIDNTQNIPLNDILLAEPEECRYIDFNDKENPVKFGLRVPTLERVRLTNVTWDSTEEDLRKIHAILKKCGGIDENGMNIPNAVVSGIVNVPSIDMEYLEELNKDFPELMISVNGQNLCTVSYYNWDGTLLYITTIEQGSNAPDIVADGTLGYVPERPTTETHKYVYRGWNDSLENIQKNKIFRAVYDTYYAVRFMNDEIQLHMEYVKEGEAAIDPLLSGVIDTPTRESSAQFDFAFIGWDKDFTKITDVMYVYATYSETIRSYEIKFFSKETTDERYLLEKKVLEYGQQVVYSGKAPTKPDVPYPQDYKFKEWSPALGIVEGDASYFAVFYDSDHILDSWTVIANNVANGTYKEKYPIGVLQRVVLTYADGSTEEVDVEVVGYDHDRTSGNGLAGLTFITKGVLKNTHNMSDSKIGNEASWINSEMRTYLTETILPALPRELRSLIVPVIKITSSGNKNSDPASMIETVDSIWTPAFVEMTDDHAHKPIYSAEGSTYERYRTIDGDTEEAKTRRVKRYGAYGKVYWTRTPYPGYRAEYWCITDSGGNTALNKAQDPYGVAFGFCIGRK